MKVHFFTRALLFICTLVLLLGATSLDAHRYPLREAYDYPVRPGSQEWADLSSIQDRRDACRVPRRVLDGLSTQALLETAADYPLLEKFHLFTDPNEGAMHIRRISNVWRELLRRDDLQAAVDQYIPLVSGDCDAAMSIISICSPQIVLPKNVPLCPALSAAAET